MNIKKGEIIKCLVCGKDKYYRISHILRSKKHFCSKQCSQIYKVQKNHPQFKHGLRKTRFYRIWISMKSRCKYSNRDNTKWYKDKGITVDLTWNKFTGFKNDMYESYLIHVENFGEQNTTLDRIDSDKNYNKNNCRWATWTEQQRGTLEEQIEILKQKPCKCKENL